MKFTIDEKVQIVKWYFSGNSLSTIINFYINKYGTDRGTPSTSGCRYSGEIFEKNGCLHNFCRKCAGRVYVSVMSDEDELNEILVCAAAELELSTRDIAIELEMSKSTVSRILRRNGYSIMNMFEDDTPKPKPTTGLEKLSGERKQIVKWYCQKNSLEEILTLFNDNFKHNINAKEEILNTIQAFETYGCIRDCKKCTESNDIQQKFTIQQIEELISKQAKELNSHKNRKKTASNSSKRKLSKRETAEPANKNIKLECTIEATSILISKNDKMNCKKSIAEGSNAENGSEKNHSDNEQNIEFVSVKPNLNILVVGEKNSNKNRKRVSTRCSN